MTARFRPKSAGGTDGAGGHRIFILDFHNVSATPCQLSGYPRRGVLYAPGKPRVTATKGSFFPIGRSKAMPPGGVTSLGLEIDDCVAEDGTGVLYRHVRVYLQGGSVQVAVPNTYGGLDPRCGLHLTPFGTWL